MELNRNSPSVRYLAAVLLAIAAQIARIPLHPATLIPFITYVPFVVVSAWFGGLGPGLVSTALCVVEVIYFALEPVGTFAVSKSSDYAGISAFLFTSALASMLVELLRRANAARHLSEERLAFATTAAQIGVWSWTPDTNELVVSGNWRNLFGVPLDILVTFETWREAVHPEDRGHALDELKRANEERRELNSQYRVVWPDGTVRWILDRGHAAYDRGGRPVSMAGVNVDVTELKRAEEALRQSEEQFRTLANAIPQLCWIAGPDGSIFWYNQRWYAYTGTTPEQMLGWGWQTVHDPEVLPTVLERWKESIRTVEPFEMVFPAARRRRGATPVPHAYRAGSRSCGRTLPLVWYQHGYQRTARNRGSAPPLQSGP